MTDEPEYVAHIDVEADKPGRWVRVDVSRPGAQDEQLPWTVSLNLNLGLGSGPDPWTWLAPDEARDVAAALTEAADRADALRADDPRDA